MSETLGATSRREDGSAIERTALKDTKKAEKKDNAEPQLHIWVAVATLAISTALVAVCAAFMVNSIDAITSRIYRVKGCQSLFVIPAFDIHPDTEGTRRMETKGLVQTVERPLEYALAGTDRWQRTVVERARTAEQQGRNTSRRARDLKEEVAGLRLKLEERTQELERKRARSREARATERDLASKEELARAQMETMRRECLRLNLDREGTGAESKPPSSGLGQGMRSESAQAVLDALSKKESAKSGAERRERASRGRGNQGWGGRVGDREVGSGEIGAWKEGDGVKGKTDAGGGAD